MKEINRKWVLLRTLLILVILLTPLIEVQLIKGPSRYYLASYIQDKYAYVAKEIYSGKPPVDLAFLGPSQTLASLNAKMIEGGLRRSFKDRQIFVQNFAHNETGIETDYLILKDLSESRGVRAAIVGITSNLQRVVHRPARLLWNPLKDNEGMGLAIFTSLYAEKILDSFSNILRFWMNEKINPPEHYENTNGSDWTYASFSNDDKGLNLDKPFERIPLSPARISLSELLVSKDNPKLRWIKEEYDHKQLFYLKKLIELSKAKGFKIYFLFHPTISPDTDPEKLDIRELPQDLKNEMILLGITEAELFGTKSAQEMEKYFYNQNHTNINGSDHFTASIFPAIKEIYEKLPH